MSSFDLGEYAPEWYFDREHRRVLGEVHTPEHDFKLIQRPLVSIERDWGRPPIYRERLILSSDKWNRDSTSAPFIALDDDGGFVKLRGLFVPTSMRGNGLAHVLLGVAFEVTRLLRQADILNTATIHKPQIPLLLHKYWFEAKRWGNRVQIVGQNLKKEGESTQLVPVIRVIKQTRDILTERGGFHFCVLEEDDDEHGAIQSWREMPEVDITTPYYVWPSKKKQFMQEQMKHRSWFMVTGIHQEEGLLLGQSIVRGIKSKLQKPKKK